MNVKDTRTRASKFEDSYTELIHLTDTLYGITARKTGSLGNQLYFGVFYRVTTRSMAICIILFVKHWYREYTKVCCHFVYDRTLFVSKTHYI